MGFASFKSPTNIIACKLKENHHSFEISDIHLFSLRFDNFHLQVTLKVFVLPLGTLKGLNIKYIEHFWNEFLKSTVYVHAGACLSKTEILVLLGFFRSYTHCKFWYKTTFLKWAPQHLNIWFSFLETNIVLAILRCSLGFYWDLQIKSIEVFKKLTAYPKLRCIHFNIFIYNPGHNTFVKALLLSLKITISSIINVSFYSSLNWMTSASISKWEWVKNLDKQKTRTGITCTSQKNSITNLHIW